MWFESWSGIGRVLLVGAAAYALLVLFLRVSGKRTLSKLNAFDLVVTVAMGSTLSSVLLDKTIPLAEGLAGFAVLIAGQYLIARLSVRSPRFARAVRSQPRLLMRDGQMLPEALRRERVTEEEVLGALRAAGLSRLEEVGAVVMESDGSLNVLPQLRTPASSLRGVARGPAGASG